MGELTAAFQNSSTGCDAPEIGMGKWIVQIFMRTDLNTTTSTNHSTSCTVSGLSESKPRAMAFLSFLVLLEIFVTRVSYQKLSWAGTAP